MQKGLEAWHAYMAEPTRAKLDALLAEDVIFHSPVVHTAQRGKAITALYLSAAAQVLGNQSFRYVREVASGSSAVLEFTCELEDVFVNGIDLITFNSDDKIVDFKVMVRPLKAIEAVHSAMGTLLQTMQGAAT